MRLWHQDLIPYLPNAQLLGQHRECCALRGLGWGKKHSTVDYVFTYHPDYLYNYHIEIIVEMLNRGYKVDDKWTNRYYRGKRSEPWKTLEYLHMGFVGTIYPEHDDDYMEECLQNLRGKGINIIIEGEYKNAI